MNNSLPVSKHVPNKWTLSRLAILVIFLGFILRLFAFKSSYIINLDGTLYIQQAKASYYHLWDSLTVCFPYLSNYPILIAFTYKVFGDWVVAAKAVSLIFGSLSLIPLYLLLRRFFDETITSFSLLIFALNPAFIDLCGKVIRGPIYWFFSLIGLYLFTLQIEKKNYLHLVFCSIALFIAAWARLEAMLYIIMSFFYIFAIAKEKKLQNLFFFLFPIILIIVILLISNIHIKELFAPQQIANRLSGALENYQTLRANLSKIIDQNPIGFSPYFFPKVRNLIWFIAIGALFVQIARAFFLPFFLIFVLGLVGLRGRIKEDPRLLYLAILSASSLILLYLQTLYNWAMVCRHIALFLFPSFCVVGFGLEKIINYLHSKFKLKKSMAYIIVFLLIFSIALPKNLKADRTDKVVFKEIGGFISRQEGNRREILIAGSFKWIRLIHFYANLNYSGAPCFNINSILTNENKGSLRFLKEKAFNYFIWDEKNWTKKELDSIRNKYHEIIIELKEWWSPELGRLILFKVI